MAPRLPSPNIRLSRSSLRDIHLRVRSPQQRPDPRPGLTAAMPQHHPPGRDQSATATITLTVSPWRRERESASVSPLSPSPAKSTPSHMFLLHRPTLLRHPSIKPQNTTFGAHKRESKGSGQFVGHAFRTLWTRKRRNWLRR